MSDHQTEFYYVLVTSWAVYVKEANFFISQGGLKENWGKNWKGPIKATSVENAR